MKIREVPLDDLVLDPNLNLRDRLDDFTVERYADSWDRLPPITVYEVEIACSSPTGFIVTPPRSCWASGRFAPRSSKAHSPMPSISSPA